MNLVMDYLNGLLDASEQRMDAIGIPKIVPIVCPYCDGRKERFGMRCTACAATGSITVETTERAK